jgi:hypothetical protein
LPKLHPAPREIKFLTVKSRLDPPTYARLESYENRGRWYFGEAHVSCWLAAAADASRVWHVCPGRPHPQSGDVVGGQRDRAGWDLLHMKSMTYRRSR